MKQNKNSELELSEQAYKYLKEQNDFDLRYHAEKASQVMSDISKRVNDEGLAIAQEISNLLSKVKVIGERELLLNSAEAIRKADNQIIHLRMQDVLLPKCAEVV